MQESNVAFQKHLYFLCNKWCTEGQKTPKTSEAQEAIKTLETTLSGYMAYDAMVGGIVSQGCTMLAEARELLKDPTKKNIREATKKVQTCKDNVAPYGSQAPEVVSQIDTALEKLQAL